MFDRPRCHDCGRFFSEAAAWKMLYSGSPLPSPDRELYRCKPCFDKLGPFDPQSGICPEYSCGVIEP